MSLRKSKKKKSRLPENVLCKRKIPLKPNPVTLYGKYAKIMLFDMSRDAEELFSVMNGSPIIKPNKSIEAYDQDNLVWKGTPHGPFSNYIDLGNHFEKINNAPDGRLFCIFDAEFDYQIGLVGLKVILLNTFRLNLDMA